MRNKIGLIVRNVVLYSVVSFLFALHRHSNTEHSWQHVVWTNCSIKWILSASMMLPNSNMNTLKVAEQLTWNQGACDFFCLYKKHNNCLHKLCMIAYLDWKIYIFLVNISCLTWLLWDWMHRPSWKTWYSNVLYDALSKLCLLCFKYIIIV